MQVLGGALKIHAITLAAALLIAPAAFAQQTPSEDASFAIREDFSHVAPAQGPAWWKVSKGASVVWIMGAPPPRLQGRLAWDRTTYRRRLKGARLVLLPHDDRSSFVEGEDWLAVRLRLEEDVIAAEKRMRYPDKRKRQNYMNAVLARAAFLRERDRLTSTHADILKEAESSRAPLVRSTVSREISSSAGIPAEDPQTGACPEETVAFTLISPSQFNRANQSWAMGDVPGLIETTPKALSPLCRRLWLGQRQENIAFQTHVVMEALRRPGKVVAVYPIDSLIAENGILARLQAAGYTVADPSLPLSED